MFRRLKLSNAAGQEPVSIQGVGSLPAVGTREVCAEPELGGDSGSPGAAGTLEEIASPWFVQCPA